MTMHLENTNTWKMKKHHIIFHHEKKQWPYQCTCNNVSTTVTYLHQQQQNLCQCTCYVQCWQHCYLYISCQQQNVYHFFMFNEGSTVTLPYQFSSKIFVTVFLLCSMSAALLLVHFMSAAKSLSVFLLYSV